MKRFPYLLAALLAVLSCSHKEPVPQKEGSVIFVKIEDSATKAQIGTSGIFSWSEADKIGVFSDVAADPVEYTLRSGAGYSVASFEGSAVEGTVFHAWYPSTAKCDGKTFRSVLPTKVRHSVPVCALEGMPLYGISRSCEDITVRSLCGVLEFNLTGNGMLQSVLLEADKPVSGEFLCNLTGAGLIAMGKNASRIISMDASGTELSFFRPTPFYFILPPGEYDELKFTVTDAQGSTTVFSASETVVIKAGELSEATSVAPDVDLINMEFLSEKNGSGCFWYTKVDKNASFCVSYLFGIATREEFEACSSDATAWLREHGRTYTSSTEDFRVLSPSTDYVAMAMATSVSGSEDAPVVLSFTTPEIHHDSSLAISIKTTSVTAKSVNYEVSLPSGVAFMSEVYILSAQEFEAATDNDLIVKCLATRAKGRQLTGSFEGLLPGIDYVLFCVCDNEQSISDLARVRFTTDGSKIGGGTEDIDEIEIQ